MTINGRPARGGIRALAWFAAVLAAVALLAGCSTARRRDQPVGLTSLLHYRDPATHRYFADTYRTGNLYLDFRPALVVDAIVEDETYRRQYVEMVRERYLLSGDAAAKLAAEQRRQFETSIDVLVFIYEGTNHPTKLTGNDPLWRLFLRDDDGQLLTPQEIVRVPDGSPTYAYLQKYFYGLDRWSQVYRVRFPKLSKGVLGQPVGPHPVQLIVTSVRGTVTLQWENAGILYANGPRAG